MSAEDRLRDRSASKLLRVVPMWDGRELRIYSTTRRGAPMLMLGPHRRAENGVWEETGRVLLLPHGAALDLAAALTDLAAKPAS